MFGLNSTIKEEYTRWQTHVHLQVVVFAWFLMVPKRNKYFSEGVRPNYLKMINQGVCPVSVKAFSYRRDCDRDWSVDRADNERGCEPFNEPG